MKVTNADGISILSRRQREFYLPDHVVRLVTGGEVIEQYEGKKDVHAIRWCGEDYKLSFEDSHLAQRIAGQIISDWINPQGYVAKISSPDIVLKIREMALKKTIEAGGIDSKKKICMLKDKSGSGWWRMVQPASFMDDNDWQIDITAAETSFEQLLEYDVIFVQRVYEWEQYHILEKLKRVGKRIVYDIDDDLFNIPLDNPASRIINRDNQFAAMACMKMADIVTTTSWVLHRKISPELENKDKMIVIPNAMDVDDRWLPTALTGSPDGNLRIFWQGSATHAEDWNECIEALDVVMGEFPNLRLVILGFLPPVIAERINHPNWKGRIEYMGFSEPESYFELIKHVRADVGLAPLKDNVFNHSKSPIKFVENSLIGVPTVASDTMPYSSIIEHGKNGYLCESKDEWVRCMRELLNDVKKRKKILSNARMLVEDDYNIKKVVKVWKSVLLV